MESAHIEMLVQMGNSPDGTERPVPSRPDIMKPLEAAGLVIESAPSWLHFGPEYRITHKGMLLALAHVGEPSA